MHAVAWMSGTLVSFCLMAIGARELSGELSVFQTLFFRSAIGLFALLLVFLMSRRKTVIRTDRVGLTLLRNVFHFFGQYGWFVGIGLLPLAEVFALEFTVPIWTLIIAAIFLREKITVRKIVAVSLGIVGVLIIVQPGYAIIDSASFIVLAAAICYAISYTVTRALSVSESAFSILFYMCLIQLPIGLILSLEDWLWPAGEQWLWLLVIGLTALSAHYCLAKAMLFTEVTTVVTLDFLRLPLIGLVGILLYAEPVKASLILGGGLMLLANLISIKQPTKAREN
ncbi:DMT family transporter [Arenicella xantha]|uniref:EamA-like transporter family protein n=1 Tax=Arenicella xantha TaxID=644221 RepID=A0A395JQM3_9GAMM|nr:DMT family transporter [Arenicella xantha]RBP53663.1 EamA-like transporter family protein [Arenicella xantha]